MTVLFERDRPQASDVGFKVVVGQRYETEPSSAEVEDLLDDDVHSTLSRRLTIGSPDRAERAVLRTTPHRLDRTPHVASLRQQLPARGDESIGIDTSGLIDGLQRTARRIAEYDRPDDVAVTLDHGMGAAQAERLVGVERGVAWMPPKITTAPRALARVPSSYPRSALPV